MKAFIIVSVIIGLLILMDIADSLTHIAKWLIENKKK